MTNNVKPNHYKGDKGDLLSSMDGFMSDDEIRGFYKGNIIKYTTRYNKKNGLEDLDKANYYIERLKEWEASKSKPSYDDGKHTNELLQASAQTVKEFENQMGESFRRMMRAKTVRGLK